MRNEGMRPTYDGDGGDEVNISDLIHFAAIADA
jgi:hypothetical protein